MTKPISNILNKVYRKYRFYIYTFAFLSLITPFIANDVPLICTSDQGTIIPVINKKAYQALVIQSNNDDVCSWRINPPIPYHAKTLNTKEKLLPPFSGRHILGTDSLGRDVFAGMLHGLRAALIIALLYIFLAGLGGLALGAIAGYFGNDLFKVSMTELLFHLTTAIIWVFIGSGILKYYSEFSVLSTFLFFTIWLLIHYVIYRLTPQKWNRNIKIPWDNIIMRFIEIYKSIPTLFILLVLLGFIRQSNVYLISFIIGVLSIPSITRIVRGEILKIKQADFVTSSTILNFSHSKILFQQILPNIIGPASVALSFGAAGAILLESTLSFLGIGLGLDEVTWGSILTESRVYYTAWWLALIPGLAIFGMILLFNQIGKFISAQYQSNSSGL